MPPCKPFGQKAPAKIARVFSVGGWAGILVAGYQPGRWGYQLAPIVNDGSRELKAFQTVAAKLLI